MKNISIGILVGLVWVSCTANKPYATDCTPKREKHVNKMQMIPLPADTVKSKNRPKY